MKPATVFSPVADTFLRIFFAFAISALPLSALSGNATQAQPLPACQPPGVPLEKNGNTDAFESALAKFADEMTATHGLDRDNLDCIFSQVRHNSTVIRLVSPFPSGTPKNWQAYRKRFIEPVRIRAGIKFWKKHEKALSRAEQEYGVPPEIIVGIIGIETTYGKNKGNFRILDALATLAFDYPEHPRRDARMALFRKELENAILLSAEQGTDPLLLKGSYAGAMGWPQFLPSSIRQYGVDFDGDGRTDLQHSPVDAIGSVARFLSQHGWKRGEPIVFPARLEADCPDAREAALNHGLEAKLTADDLHKICIRPPPGPGKHLFGLVDLQNGFEPTEYWLGTANFFAITHYNRSYFYAMAVITLGNKIRKARQDHAGHKKNPS